MALPSRPIVNYRLLKHPKLKAAASKLATAGQLCVKANAAIVAPRTAQPPPLIASASSPVISLMGSVVITGSSYSQKNTIPNVEIAYKLKHWSEKLTTAAPVEIQHPRPPPLMFDASSLDKGVIVRSFIFILLYRR